MNVSVAMATYNGEEYIVEQIESIVEQLNKDDELIISDDGSTDKTLQIIKNYMEMYSNIKLVHGPKNGIFNNFENAISNCSKQIIFLSDQDDIWIKGKIDRIRGIFEKNQNVNIVMHSGYRVDNNKQIIGDLVTTYKRGFLRNLISSRYWGCCMALRTDYIMQFIPFERKGIAHDQLFGLFSEYDGCTYYINERFIYHRIHGSNETRRSSSVLDRIRFRVVLLVDFICCYKKKSSGRK